MSARERARQVMARKRAAEMERALEIEEMLSSVLAAADAEQRAAARRRDALAAAHAAYDKTVCDVNRRSGQALRRMRTLGEPLGSIAAMTGLSRQRITELIRLANADTDASLNGSPTPAPPMVSPDTDGHVDQGGVAARAELS